MYLVDAPSTWQVIVLLRLPVMNSELNDIGNHPTQGDFLVIEKIPVLGADEGLEPSRTCVH